MGYFPFVLLAAAALLWSRSGSALDWRAYLRKLLAFEIESKVSFCKSMAELREGDATTTKGESFPIWAARQRAAGLTILVDSTIRQGDVRTQKTRVYAVETSRVTELVKNGHFLEV